MEAAGADSSGDCEQTLHISRQVDVYQIPPRGPSGWKSGDWLVSAKIFTGRLRVISRGMDCEVRLEDANSDQLFACCPIPYGQRNICVETVADSSRYFILRVVDPVSKRHAFLGMGFQQRGEAFDFNEALVRHEKWAERDKASSQMAAQGGAVAAAEPQPGSRAPQQTLQAAAATKEMAGLYAHNSIGGLQAGETIRVNVKPSKAAGAGGGSWLTSGVVAVTAQPAGAPGLFKLAPPPADLLSGHAAISPVPAWQSPSFAAPPPAAAAPPQQAASLIDFGFDAAPVARPPVPQAAPVPPASSDWAVFD